MSVMKKSTEFWQSISLDKGMIITKDGLVYGGIESELISKEALKRYKLSSMSLRTCGRTRVQ